jgi:hypothetical protein
MASPTKQVSASVGVMMMVMFLLFGLAVVE